MNKQQIEALEPATLAQFSGTERYYRHWLSPRIIMTDGIHHVTENGMAWFVDIIASVQHKAALRAEPFQAWTLSKNADGSAKALCTDGNEQQLYSQKIPCTDYPFETFEAFAAHDGENLVVMLPSEY